MPSFLVVWLVVLLVGCFVGWLFCWLVVVWLVLGYLIVWLIDCEQNTISSNQTTKQQNNKKHLELCSLIRNFELRSKLLPLDNSQSKTIFYLELCSLIRNFVP